MRILLLLCLLQTGAILFLLFRETEVPGDRPSIAVNREATGATDTEPVESRELDDERLRQIIREEFRRLFAADTSPDVGADLAANLPRRNATEERNQREYIAQQMAYYRSSGVISPADMHKLQAGIAKLSPQDRREMMSKLVQALNAGEIDGRL